jgi:hypothetical protein
MLIWFAVSIRWTEKRFQELSGTSELAADPVRKVPTSLFERDMVERVVARDLAADHRLSLDRGRALIVLGLDR